MYNIIADLHTHSLASTHAYSTIREMVDSAAEKGLKAIAITDHARTMPGAPGPWFFNSMHELPLLYRGILLIAGMEANVIGAQNGQRGSGVYAVKTVYKLQQIHVCRGLAVFCAV